MCVKRMNQAFDTNLKPTSRLVLLALADHVNSKRPQMGCWPSVDRLCLRTGLAERTVQTALKHLEANGHISRKYRKNKTTVYLVHPQKPEASADEDLACESRSRASFTPAAAARHSRSKEASTPAAAAPKSEIIKKEPKPSQSQRRRSAESIGEIIAGLPLTALRSMEGSTRREKVTLDEDEAEMTQRSPEACESKSD